jgi:hypothetical protein
MVTEDEGCRAAMATGTRPEAAVAISNPFDIGAAWRRMHAASVLSVAYWSQLAIVIRCSSRFVHAAASTV